MRFLESDRRNAICNFRGPISLRTLPVPEARAAVEDANRHRAQRRLLKNSPVSEAEVELLAALLYYGEWPELQYPVGPYDADFFFPRYSTAVEVDGKEHANRKTQDERRDWYFSTQGIHTVRVPAKDVWRDPLRTAHAVVAEMVSHWIKVA